MLLALIIRKKPEVNPASFLFLLFCKSSLFLFRLVGDNIQRLLIRKVFCFLILGDFEVVLAFFDIRAPAPVQNLDFGIFLKGLDMLFGISFPFIENKLNRFLSGNGQWIVFLSQGDEFAVMPDVRAKTSYSSDDFLVLKHAHIPRKLEQLQRIFQTNTFDTLSFG